MDELMEIILKILCFMFLLYFLYAVPVCMYKSIKEDLFSQTLKTEITYASI